MTPRLAEAWLLATVLVAGLAVGSLGLLLLGRLLGRHWLTPIDDELEPAALTMPLALLIALPLVAEVGSLFGVGEPGAPRGEALVRWFDPDSLLLRAGLCFVAWTLLAFWARGRTHDVRTSAFGLAVLLPTVSVAGLDWVLSRGTFWWTGLLGFAFAASQLAPALALAFLANAVQRERIERLHDRSLRTALLTLALATLGLWFLQFLTAWMGNLPAAAAWYEARSGEGRGALLAAAVAMLGAAIVLLLRRTRARAPVVIAAVLILAQHALHTTWLLRPAGTPRPDAFDLVAVALLVSAWGIAYVVLVVRHERREAARRRADREASNAQSGMSGSS